MKKIGLTGGIGSGKSTIAKIFNVMGVPVYYSDDRARQMYFKPEVKKQVKTLLGEEAYINEKEINRAYISSKIFSDTQLLAKINDIIHPAVGKDFEQWLAAHENAPFVLKESAILFETGIYKSLDATILVVSPEKMRAERIAKRDGLSEEEVIKRFKSQLNDENKIPLADYVVFNDEVSSLIEQAVEIKNTLENSAKK